jgi:hypothetical protein
MMILLKREKSLKIKLCESLRLDLPGCLHYFRGHLFKDL